MSNLSSSIPLSERHCVHRDDESDRLSGAALADFLGLVEGWALADDDAQHFLEKTFATKDFDSALRMAVQVGQLADQQDHHPILIVEWGQLSIRWWTHSLNSLSENDFIMAAKVDQLLEE